MYGGKPFVSSDSLTVFHVSDGRYVIHNKVELPAFPGGAPMTYSVDGTQYLVVAVGGLGDKSELVALTLP